MGKTSKAASRSKRNAGSASSKTATSADALTKVQTPPPLSQSIYSAVHRTSEDELQAILRNPKASQAQVKKASDAFWKTNVIAFDARFPWFWDGDDLSAEIVDGLPLPRPNIFKPPQGLYLPRDREWGRWGTSTDIPRYGPVWTHAGGGTASVSAFTGELSTFCTPQPEFYVSRDTEASIGVWYAPPEGLWTIEASAEYVGYHQWRFDTQDISPLTGNVRYYAYFAVSVWQLDPNTNQLALLQPNRTYPLFDRTWTNSGAESGPGGSPMRTDFHLKRAETSLQANLWGGQQYCISVTAETFIDMRYQSNGRQVAPGDVDATYNIHHALIGNVPKIRIRKITRLQ